MNNESPLVPQGSFLEQKNKGRARVRIAVFIVLAVHGIGLFALLMQGCQKAPDSSTTSIDTNAPVQPSFAEQAQPIAPVPDTSGPVYSAQPSTPVFQPQTNVAQPIGSYPPPVEQTVGAGTQHKVVKGDTLGKIARQYKVSLQALQDANPGIDPLRLRIDQTIQVPAATAAAMTAGSTGAAESVVNGQQYKVKSGDTLSKIAKQYGTTPKAIRNANGLKTDRIRVGETLRIPSSTAATTTGAPPPFNTSPDGASSAPLYTPQR